MIRSEPHKVRAVIRRLGILHGYAEYQKPNWVHVDRPRWFDGTPVITATQMSELFRLVIDAGERLYK